VPPYWQIEPTDAAVLLNGSLTVSCEARGHPPPSIYWTKFTSKYRNNKQERKVVYVSKTNKTTINRRTIL
jgi:hypothetical protein